MADRFTTQQLGAAYNDYRAMMEQGMSEKQAIQTIFAKYGNPKTAGSEAIAQTFNPAGLSDSDKKSLLQELFQMPGVATPREVPDVAAITSREASKTPGQTVVPILGGLAGGIIGGGSPWGASTGYALASAGMREALYGQQLPQNIAQTGADIVAGGLAPSVAKGFGNVAAKLAPNSNILQPIAQVIGGGAATVAPQAAIEAIGAAPKSSWADKLVSGILGGGAELVGQMAQVPTVKNASVNAAMKKLDLDNPTMRALTDEDTMGTLASLARDSKAKGILLDAVEQQEKKLKEKFEFGEPGQYNDPAKADIAARASRAIKAAADDSIAADVKDLNQRMQVILEASGLGPKDMSTVQEMADEIVRDTLAAKARGRGLIDDAMFSELSGGKDIASFKSLKDIGTEVVGKAKPAYELVRETADAIYKRGTEGVKPFPFLTGTYPAMMAADKAMTDIEQAFRLLGADVDVVSKRMEPARKIFKRMQAGFPTGNTTMGDLAELYKEIGLIAPPGDNYRVNRIIGDLKGKINQAIRENVTDPKALQEYSEALESWTNFSNVRDTLSNVIKEPPVDALGKMMKDQPGTAMGEAMAAIGVSAPRKDVMLREFADAAKVGAKVDPIQLKTVFPDMASEIDDYAARVADNAQFYDNAFRADSPSKILLPGSMKEMSTMKRELAQQAQQKTIDYLNSSNIPQKVKNKIEAAHVSDVMNAAAYKVKIGDSEVPAGVNRVILSQILADNPAWANQTKPGRFFSAIANNDFSAEDLVKYADIMASLKEQDMGGVAGALANSAKYNPKDVSAVLRKAEKQMLTADPVQGAKNIEAFKSEFLGYLGRAKDKQFDNAIFDSNMRAYSDEQLEAILGSKKAVENVRAFSTVAGKVGATADKIRAITPNTTWQQMRTMLSLVSGAGAITGFGLGSFPAALSLAMVAGLAQYPSLMAKSIITGGGKMARLLELTLRSGKLAPMQQITPEQAQEAPNGEQR